MTVLNGFWVFPIFLFPLIILVGVVFTTERSIRRTVDVLPEIYERGLMTRDVTSFWVVELVYPYDKLERVEVDGDYVHLSGGRSRFTRWSVHVADLGPEGVDTLLALAGGAPPPSQPPDLVVYGDKGRLGDGPPLIPKQ